MCCIINTMYVVYTDKKVTVHRQEYIVRASRIFICLRFASNLCCFGFKYTHVFTKQVSLLALQDSWGYKQTGV